MKITKTHIRKLIETELRNIYAEKQSEELTLTEMRDPRAALRQYKWIQQIAVDVAAIKASLQSANKPRPSYAQQQSLEQGMLDAEEDEE
jgi:uncharacterized protein YutE (UPF0331/DUF86 family)